MASFDFAGNAALLQCFQIAAIFFPVIGVLMQFIENLARFFDGQLLQPRASFCFGDLVHPPVPAQRLPYQPRIYFFAFSFPRLSAFICVPLLVPILQRFAQKSII